MINLRTGRRNIGLLIALLMLVLPAFIGNAVGLAHSNALSKPAPTPKKKATPTPKKKTTPTPKKTPAKSTAKTKAKPTPKTTAKTSKTPAKSTSKSNTSKTADRNKNSKTADRNKNTKSTDRNSKTAKNDKNANSKNSKTQLKSQPKSVAKTTTKPTTKPVEKKPKETTVKPTDSAAEVIVASYSVPVRPQARASSPTITRVRIGTTLKVIEKNSSWYRVSFQSNGKSTEGWIAADSIREQSQSDRIAMYRQIADRNFRSDLEFAPAVELYEFLDSVTPNLDKSDASAELELKRLQVLRIALKQIPVGQSSSSPFREFLKIHEKAIVYNDPAGVNLVAANQFWDIHTKYQKSVVSDTIAWEAALNPLPGECEGYINCHLFDIRMRFGEYLNNHPTGKHAAEALTSITVYLDPIVADSARKEVYTGPTDVSDRAEFNNLVAELRTIVARLGFVEKEKTLQQLRVIAEAYR